MTPDTKEQLRGAGFIVAMTVLAFGALALTFPPLPPPPPAVPVIVPVTLWLSNSLSGNETGYKIYRGTNSRKYTDIFECGKNLTNVIPGQQMLVPYYYAATAYNAAGESDFGNELHVTPTPESADRVYSFTSGTPNGPRTNKVLVLVTQPTNDLYFSHEIIRTNWTAWK